MHNHFIALRTQRLAVFRNTLRVGVLCALILTLGAGCATLSSLCSTGPYEIQNPYDGVKWTRTGRYKAGLHVHTRASDGRLYPHEAIDRYQALGYDILAITDHDRMTHPWTSLSEKFGEGYEDRDPEVVGMLDIEANEVSRHHHMGSYWNSYEAREALEDALREIGENGGRVVLNHPGRYKQKVDWYVDLFTRYPQLIGIEIYNQGDRYPKDRATWDSILTEMMPERPVWGHSNDDMHGEKHIGRNWAVILAKKRSDKTVRAALEGGHFFWVYAPGGHEGPAVPFIYSITVSSRTGTITVSASENKRIEWIADGQVVHTGPSIALATTEGIGRYVRAVVIGTDGKTCVGTQPFGLTPRQ